MKINDKYSLNTEQFCTFRTFILIILFGGLALIWALMFIINLLKWEEIIISFIIMVIFLLLFGYWFKKDLLIKNKTYTSNTDIETKYDNYTLAELIFYYKDDQSSGLIYQLYRKLIIQTLNEYDISMQLWWDKNNIEYLAEYILRSLHDESYKLKKMPRFSNLQDAQIFVDEQIPMILYNTFSISKKYHKKWYYNYNDLIDRLSVSRKYKRNSKQAQKIILRTVKKSKNISNMYTQYHKDNDTHLLLTTYIVYLFCFEYYTKDKIDPFALILFIASMWTLWW